MAGEQRLFEEGDLLPGIPDGQALFVDGSFTDNMVEPPRHELPEW